MTEPASKYNRYESDPQTYRSQRRRRGRGGHHRWRWLKILGVVFVLAVIAAVAATAGVVLAATRNLPSLDALHSQINGQTSTIYDSTGHVIATLHGAQNRTVLASQAIPNVMKEATVASEDQRFYENHGIDFQGLARAILADLKAGSFVEGASTITQQYVKNAYTGSERTFTRKIREAVLAWELAGKWSKDKILTAYLNTTYYGHGAYGVEAGAETYFHEHARQLKLYQAALLVAVAKLPTDYDPVLYPQVARTIRNQVLDKMASQGYITLAQASAAKAEPIKVFSSPPNVNSNQASYFVDYVTQLLVAKYGYAEVFEGGLRIYTSLNSAWQADALQVVKQTVSPLNFGFKPSAALVAIDPQTGYIRAMVGGLDFQKQQFNLATQALRQPGSSMKPFVLAAAIEQGMNPDTTYYSSHSPITIPLGLGAAPWVVNGDGPGGLESVTNATVISDNVVFAQLSVDVGPANTVAVAHAMGITSPLAAVPSITLGTSSVTPLELADAYATFASGGIHHAPQAIVRVVLPNGKVDWQPSTVGNRAIPAGVAATVNRVLEKVASYGTGSSTGAYFPYPRAGKTGTTDQSWDVWYSGFTPQLAASVWMGNIVRNTPMNGAFGATYCAPMWAKFFALALNGQSHPGFATASWTFTPWKGHYATALPSPSASPSPSSTPSGTPTVTPTPTKTPTSTPTIVPTPPPTNTPTPKPTTTKAGHRVPPSPPA